MGDGTHWSEWAAFQTACDRPEPFRFLYLGDAQNSIKSHWSRVIRAAFAAAPDARFIVHAGDLVDRGTDDVHWGEWFQAAGWINTMIPSLPSPGNHEYEKPREERTPGALPAITGHWRAQFTLPQNGPKGLEETAYFIDYQGARIISLNSNEAQEKQAEWLDQILSKNPGRWTIVTFHHPIYSSAKDRDNAKIRKLWQPIFDRHHVDLVLQGHDHTYARTGLETTAVADGGRAQRVPKAARSTSTRSPVPSNTSSTGSRSRSERLKGRSFTRLSPSTAVRSASRAPARRLGEYLRRLHPEEAPWPAQRTRGARPRHSRTPSAGSRRTGENPGEGGSRLRKGRPLNVAGGLRRRW